MTPMNNAMRHVWLPRALRYLGYAPAPAHRFLAGQRAFLLNELKVEVMLDVGANVGQYGGELRASGFAGTICSFEPGAGPFIALQRAAAASSSWEAHRFAFGRDVGQASLTTWPGEGSTAASLLKPVAGVSRMLGPADEEVVHVSTIDAFLRARPDIAPGRSALKVDVQGSEGDVLSGAEDNLAAFALIELEVPLATWYEGGSSLSDLFRTLAPSHMPAAVMTERFVKDWRGAADVDAIFVRRDLSHVPE